MTPRFHRRNRGQGAVEFVIMTFLLFLMMFLIIQLMWVAVQKWQFNHFAAYATRSWQVYQDDSAHTSLYTALAASVAFRWHILGKDYVKAIVVWDDNAEVDEIKGIKYVGAVQVWEIYRPYVGESFALSASLPFGITIPNFGLFVFETFIPAVKEPREEPNRWDNDCDDTPCTSGNKR